MEFLYDKIMASVGELADGGTEKNLLIAAALLGGYEAGVLDAAAASYGGKDDTDKLGRNLDEAASEKFKLTGMALAVRCKEER